MTIALDPECLTDAGIVLGRRGAGKSNALMTLFEHELDAGHRAVMVDPKGDRFGIRMNPDGSPSRFTIPIFGGDHGDLPLDDDMGERMGRLVAEHNLSCLIDLSQMSLGAKQRFMMGFAPTLLQHNRAALTLFIEEVDQFANQDPRYQPAMLVHHIANFSTLGRQRGIVPWVASQRPAKVNATVRSQADTFVGMKVTSPLDRDAYREWFKGHGKEAAARVDEEVGRLQPGEALVWIGATEFFDKVQFPLASTFDSGRTPKHGETIAAVTLPPIDLGEIRAALGAGQSEVSPAAEALPSQEIAALHARIAELEDEAAKWKRQHQFRGEVLKRTQVERDELRQRLHAVRVVLGTPIPAINLPLGRFASEPTPAPVIPTASDGGNHVDRSASRATASKDIGAAVRVSSGPGDGSASRGRPDPETKLGAERRPLATLAGVYPSGMTEAQWGTAAGFKRTGGTWGTYKSRLRSAGLIEQRGDRWYATEAGASAVGAVDKMPPPGLDLLGWWVGKLQGVGPMADALAQQWPNWIAREDLAARIGMSAAGGTFGTYLSRLAGPGLIERDRERGVRLSAEVMGR